MDAQELETYEYQLSQIKEALAKDPANEEMLNLKKEIEDLIALTKEYLGAQAPAASTSASASPAPSSAAAKPKLAASSSASSAKASPAPSSSGAAPKPTFKTGDNCSCRYSDGKWYPARITHISGSADQPVYTVVYKGFDTPEVVTAANIRAASKWDNGNEAAAAAAAASEKRKADSSNLEDSEKERKRKKNEKKAETQKAKAEEQGARQKSWQSFAKKGAKKGISIPGMSGESMFRSPEDMKPTAKVGVVGGGRGVTKTADRKRQTFQALGDE
ncbi:hypothetical protein JCM6882_007797 [Rhodosporidiobolus microsporus]